MPMQADYDAAVSSLLVLAFAFADAVFCLVRGACEAIGASVAPRSLAPIIFAAPKIICVT